MRPAKSRSRLGVWTGGAAALAGAWLAAEGLAEGGPAPADAPEPPLVALGRRLFHDPAVSRTGRHACASCHDPEHGWSDARKFSDDEAGPTFRHSQPVTDLGLASKAGFHWDGEFANAGEIALARIGDEATVAKEAAKRMPAGVVNGRNSTGSAPSGYATNPLVTVFRPLPIPDRLAMDSRYAAAFHAAFGDEKVDSDRLVKAVTAFVATLRTSRSAVDEHLAGEGASLPVPAARGLELFRGKAACATCHVLDRDEDGRVRLTDGLHHNTGVATAQLAASRQAVTSSGGELPDEQRRALQRLVTKSMRGVPPFQADPGREGRTGADADKGAFKTPSLRDVARRGPYMHDGSLATLEDVVRYYAKGGTPNDHLDSAIRPVALSDQDVSDLVAFLRALDGAERAGALPRRREERRLRLKIVDPAGRPVPGLAFEAVPAGETLGKAPTAMPIRLTTAGAGEATLAFPQSTHVLLRAPQFEIAGGTPIPDTCEEVEVVAAPLDRITVLLRAEDLTGRTGDELLPERLEALVENGPTVVVVNGNPTIGVPTQPGQRDAAAPPERFVFVRMRTVDPVSAIYSAPLGENRSRAVLLIPAGDGTVRKAIVDLSGGWSEPSRISPVREIKRRKKTK